MTKSNRTFKYSVPIIQGGMAWVAEHHLAAAVSEAGGLGLIGGGQCAGRGGSSGNPEGEGADGQTFWSEW